MADSYQDILKRSRPPRVEVLYTQPEVESPVPYLELPFVIGVLADLSGQPVGAPPPLAEREFVRIDRDDFGRVMARFAPRVAFGVPNRLTDIPDERLRVDLRFDAMEDFEPDRVAARVPVLNELLGIRRKLVELLCRMEGNDALEKLLAEVLDDTGKKSAILAALEPTGAAPPPAPPADGFDSVKWMENALARMKLAGEARTRGSQALHEFIKSALQPGQVVNTDVETNIKLWISTIDRKLSAQVNEILHHPNFQKLEATWRGLHRLVHRAETGETLKLRVMNVTKDELRDDLERAGEFDLSETFEKVYEECRWLGGFPFGLLIADDEFDVRRIADVKLLQKLAGIAAAAQAPLVAAASARSFGFSRWAELANPRDLARIFTADEYAQWNAFRESEESRYVALTLPRAMARLPYGQKFTPVAEFAFEEDADGTDHDKYLWMNAAWCYAEKVADAFHKFWWPARTRGVYGGGQVEELAVHTFPADDGEMAMQGPTEAAMNARREMELSRLGFLPLVHARRGDCAAFSDNQSCQKCKPPTPNVSTTPLFVGINYLLCAGRFTHTMMVMVRNKIEPIDGSQDLEQWLNRWLGQYVAADPQLLSDHGKATKPLLAASVGAAQVPGWPGAYRLSVQLTPHFQLEPCEITVTLIVRQLGLG